MAIIPTSGSTKQQKSKEGAYEALYEAAVKFFTDFLAANPTAAGRCRARVLCRFIDEPAQYAIVSKQEFAILNSNEKFATFEAALYDVLATPKKKPKES